MSDPFEELRDLGAGMPARPLPASEVRRRGDRMRRRRTAFQSAGAAAVVAALAGGGLLVGQSTTDTAPPPRPATQAPSPTPSASATEPPEGWRTEIPGAFPLGVGLPEPEPAGDVPPWSTSDAVDVAWSLLPCADRDTGQSSFPSDAQRTDASFIFAQAPARSFVRHLVVYRDGGAAEQAVDQIVDQAESCPPAEAIPGITEFRWDVSVTSAFGGEEAWLLSGGEYDLASDARGTSRIVLGLVREGNAVLVARLGDESAAGDPADLTEPAAAEWAEHVTTMVDAMCVFALDPCARQPEGPSASIDTLEPDGLGSLRLGMSAAEAEATQGLTLEDGHGAACTAFSVLDEGSVLATGSISEEFGVETIVVRRGVATPEGIAVGSTIEDVRTSYAHLVGDETTMSATASDATAYWFEFDDGVVSTLRVQLIESTCG